MGNIYPTTSSYSGISRTYCLYISCLRQDDFLCCCCCLSVCVFILSFEKLTDLKKITKKNFREWSHSLYTHSSVTELTVQEEEEEEEKTPKRIQPLDPDVVVECRLFFFFFSLPSLFSSSSTWVKLPQGVF